MYICINCGSEMAALYRRYCPSVLKLLKCQNCGLLADKYIEYDPVIVLVDMILMKKQAYRHLLYNSNFKAYWKLMIVLWLSESFRSWSFCTTSNCGHSCGTDDDTAINDILRASCNFYIALLSTGCSLGAFLGTVIIASEIRWWCMGRKRPKSRAKDVIRAVTIGGCGKLLGLLGIIWDNIETGPHYILIEGYAVLCLLTAHSVVSYKTGGKVGSFFELAGGFLVYNCCSKSMATIVPVNTFDIVRNIKMMTHAR